MCFMLSLRQSRRELRVGAARVPMLDGDVIEVRQVQELSRLLRQAAAGVK